MKTTLNIPQPITVEYDDTPFYEMIEQYDNPRISDESAAVMVENANHYIKISRLDMNADDTPPLMLDDIVLICKQEILKKLICKYQQ